MPLHLTNKIIAMDSKDAVQLRGQMVLEPQSSVDVCYSEHPDVTSTVILKSFVKGVDRVG